MNEEYSVEQFMSDCKSLGWYESDVGPAWKDELDLPLEEGDLERVLKYKNAPDDVPVIMDFWKKDSEKGVRFKIEYMGFGRGCGLVTSSKELCTYMKVAGYDSGRIPN